MTPLNASNKHVLIFRNNQATQREEIFNMKLSLACLFFLYS